MQNAIALDESGRMIPTDRDALTIEVAAHLREAAVGLLALGDHRSAIALLTKALPLCDERRAVAVHLNLGDAHRYAGDLDAAEPHYLRAHRLAEVHVPGLLSFCFQHLGKQRLDQGRVEEARALLESALALRTDPELVESTEAALRLVERRSTVESSGD